LTISVAFGLLAALLRPEPELDELELEELELELEPHAASRSMASSAAIVAGAKRIARAPELLVDFIVPPSVVRVIRPPSLVRSLGRFCRAGPLASNLLDSQGRGQRAFDSSRRSQSMLAPR
jgi:hypothetical protein